MLFSTPMPVGRKAKPFNDPEWIFELKYDGFRALAVVEYGGCTLFSRNGHAYRSFADPATKIGNVLMPRSMVLDGEIVSIDDRGRCQFNDLLFRRGEPCFVALIFSIPVARMCGANLCWIASTNCGGLSVAGCHQLSTRIASRV